MATYHTIKCPHCNSIVERSIGKPQHLGSPFRICRSCGMKYIDTNYKEAALLTKTDFILSYPWVAAVLRVVVSLFLVVAPVSWMINIGFEFIFLIAMFAGIAILYTPIKQLVILRRYISLKDEKLNQEIEVSKARLSDPKYVIALWKAGAYVTYEIVEWAKDAVNNVDDTVVSAQNDIEDRTPENKICFCRKCGTQIDADSRFCRKCGTKVKEEQQ